MITTEKDEIVTSDFSQFGYREVLLTKELLSAWTEQGLPKDFYPYRIQIMFNKNSGFVFLTNEDFQVAMMNGDKLESWYSCPNCGEEGFAEDITIDEEICGCNHCKGE